MCLFYEQIEVTVLKIGSLSEEKKLGSIQLHLGVLKVHKAQKMNELSEHLHNYVTIIM